MESDRLEHGAARREEQLPRTFGDDTRMELAHRPREGGGGAFFGMGGAGSSRDAAGNSFTTSGHGVHFLPSLHPSSLARSVRPSPNLISDLAIMYEKQLNQRRPERATGFRGFGAKRDFGSAAAAAEAV